MIKRKTDGIESIEDCLNRYLQDEGFPVQVMIQPGMPPQVMIYKKDQTNKKPILTLEASLHLDPWRGTEPTYSYFTGRYDLAIPTDKIKEELKKLNIQSVKSKVQ
jgi:hypothetical protein